MTTILLLIKEVINSKVGAREKRGQGTLRGKFGGDGKLIRVVDDASTGMHRPLYTGSLRLRELRFSDGMWIFRFVSLE